MTTRRTPADVLRDAADLIEHTGWGDKICAWTAIAQIADRLPSPDARRLEQLASSQLKTYLGLPDSSEVFSIWEWNDSPERSEAEVVAALRGAA